MIRPILIELALFASPFVLYSLFLWTTRSTVFTQENWPTRVVTILMGCAVVLMLVGFLAFAHYSGVPRGGTYVPAHIDEQGRFVPGQVK